MPPRWWKLLRDVQQAPGRFVLMLLALTVSIVAVTTTLVAYTTLTREMPRNYAQTRPASAHFRLDRVDPALLQEIRRHPDVVAASTGSATGARLRIGPDEWLPMVLFVAPDFGRRQVGRVRPVAGAATPALGTLLIERSALALTRAALGQGVDVETSPGHRRALRIAGVVHDPALSPAWQENVIYAYATPETLALLGERADMQWLRLIVRNHDDGAQAIERSAGSLARWLQARGHTVHEVRVPPPGKHPHQSQMTGVLLLLLSFSLLAMGLGAVLTATIIGGWLAQQARQIAIMKAIGARARQLGALYLVLVALLGAVALAIGLPLGLLAGRTVARATAERLNLDLGAVTVAPAVFVVVAALAIAVPVLVAWVPIAAATRRSVRAAIDDHGVSHTPRSVLRLPAPWPLLAFALRNTFRRRLRLALTVGLLATAGALFLASLNLKAAKADVVAQAAADRHYDLGVGLHRPVDARTLTAAIEAIPGAARAEAWPARAAAVDRGEALMLTHAYPDGGHGALTLRAVPPGSTFIALKMLQGRWLTATDTDAVVLNSSASAHAFPGVGPGNWIALRVGRRVVRLQVIGIARELMAGAALYTTPGGFGRAVEHPQQTDVARVTLRDPAQAAAFSRDLRVALARHGMDVRTVVSTQEIGAGQAAHMRILILALIAIAITMAIIGTLGLMAALTGSVIERTRELGVLRTIGARSGDISRIVLIEGLTVGLLGWLLALPLSLPFSAVIGAMLTRLTDQPLALGLSPGAAALWLGVVLVACALACVLPARYAGRLTIRQTLAYT